ncbi:ABC transporter ATP-binding protein [Parasphingorhabdus sp.]|uniref:ABC transporter ATP-binding protein n=1 Tax=Parasphingorhabdus sp. TaxID=2709688 RepID=UPI003BAECD38
MMETLVETHNLSAGYQGQAVIANLNLNVKKGEIVALLGTNGVGKTTTLMTLAGTLPPVDGEVSLFGIETKRPLYRRVREGLGFISDRRSLIRKLSVRDNLRLQGGSVEAALSIFPELADHLGRPAGLLSGGQQQMLTVARCLASQPHLLLVDELSLGLAPLIVKRLLATLRSAADNGLGVLLVEQHVSQALSISDRGYVLGRGKVQLEGSARELRQQGTDIEAAYLQGETLREKTIK